MNYLDAIILGIVQGLTEFIPISSTAHLVFAARWTNIFDGNPQLVTASMAVIQLGTIAAVLVYFANDLILMTRSFIADHLAIITGRRGKALTESGEPPPLLTPESKLCWLIAIGSIPIGTIGFLFKDTIAGPETKNLWVIAIMLIAIAVLMGIAELVGKQRKELKQFGVIDAISVGFAQVLALMPGASRSGSTIMAGLFAGQKREAAARFSFLLSIPAITAAGVLQLREVWDILPAESSLPLIVSSITAGIVGYLAIWFLLAFLRNNSTFIFILYRLVIGAAILVLLFLGVINPNVSI